MPSTFPASSHVKNAQSQFKSSSLSCKFSLLLILCPFLFIPLFYHSPSQLPPNLAPLLADTQPVYPPKAINDWKRPLTIAAYATFHKTKVRLTLFTTGVHTQAYGRSFSAIGCKAGDVIVPSIPELDRESMTTCDFDRSSLIENASVTILLNRTDALKKAMKRPQKLAREIFIIYPEDITILPRAQRRDLPEDIAEVKTVVNWKSSFIDAPTGERYELCAVNSMRQYPFLLNEWMNYYRRMGVDYFYIYENNANEPLRKYVDSRFAEVVYWPWERSQLQSFNHFLVAGKNRCKYVAFFDADEYAMVGDRKEGALKRYLKHRNKQGYQQIAFLFLNMVNNGYVRRPNGHVPDLYTRREKGQKVGIGKVIIDMDAHWFTHVIHEVRGRSVRTYWNSTMELKPLSFEHNAMLVHYTKRSWEDFCAKHATGGATAMMTYLPKKVLDVNKPDPEYMNEGYEEFTGFRKRWAEIVARKDHGLIALVREREDKLQCMKHYCPGCIFRKMSRKTCTVHW